MSQSKSRPYLTIAMLLLGATIALPPFGRAIMAGRSEYGSTHPERTPFATPPDAAALGIEPVQLISSLGDSIGGWYLPSDSGAAVLLAHGSGSDRTQMLAAARLLRHVGIGSLLLDGPGHGASGGRVSFGLSEKRAFEAGLEFLFRRPDVDPDRVGAYGFSAGAVGVLQVADDRRLRAVALAGCPTDLRVVTRREYAQSGRLAQWASVAVLRLTGVDLMHGQPIEMVSHMRDRPLLLISGEADSLVPPSDADQLAAVAPNATRLLVPTLGHREPMANSSLAATTTVNFFVAALAKRRKL